MRDMTNGGGRPTRGRSDVESPMQVALAGATSCNKQVAPTPRCARLRRTPAQDIARSGSVPDRIEERCFVGTRGRAGVATLERYVKALDRGVG